MNIFFDTEFTGLHKDTTLISIGLIAEDGRTFYAEFVDYSRVQIDDWIQRNVIDNLKFKELGSFLNTRDGNVEAKGTKQYISKYLREWLESFDQSIQLVSDVCHYDMVLFIDLFGSAFDLPTELYPNKELELGDKYDIIKDFLEKNIEIIDEIEEYTDLEKGYSEKVLIIKYNNKLYGIDFFQSPYAGTELRGCGGFIDERPEYKEVQVTTYQLK